MLRHRNRSVLFGLAAGVVLALGVRGGVAADVNWLLAKVENAARTSPFSSDQPFADLFRQSHTALSQPSTSSMSFGALSFRSDTDFRDTTKTDGNSFAGRFIGDSSKWQANRVGYANSEMNLGDAFRLKTRFGASTYDASAEFLKSLDEKKGSAESQRSQRFASHLGPASGAAVSTRAEQDILTLGDVKMTLFQEFAQVHSYFEDIKFSDKALRKQTREDVFSSPDRQTLKNGILLAQGSSGVMFSQSTISDLSGTAASFYREQRFNSKAWLGVRDVVTGSSNWADSALGTLLPSNVWAGYSEGAVTQNAAGGSTTVVAMPNTDATIKNLDAGLFWQWNRTYASVSAYRTQKVDDRSLVSTAEGADVSLGVREKNWSASAYASLSRWNSVDMGSRSDYQTLDGGASFSVLLERWPDVTLSVEVSNYSGTYTAWDGKDTGKTVSAGIAFDLTKYLVERPGQSHKLFYYARNEGYDGQWGASNSSSRTIDHVFGTAFRTAL